MRYSLDLQIIGSQTYLDSIKTELPAKSDSIVDSELYDAPTVSENMDRLGLKGRVKTRRRAIHISIRGTLRTRHITTGVI